VTQPSYWRSIISGPTEYDVMLRTAPPRDQLSRAQEQVLDEVFDEFGHWYRWDLVKFVHTLPEWHDAHGSSIPISVRDLLSGGGLDGEQVDDIEASLLGEDAMASLLDD
jgi:hypothetical protein